MIQFRMIEENLDSKQHAEELAKMLQFLEDNNIEYDIEPPRKFKEWKTIGKRTFLITKEM